MLIDNGDLINGITDKPIDPYSTFIGVLRNARRKDDSAPLVNIARVHEYGFHGMVQSRTGTPYLLNIPARSYLRPSLRAIEPKLRKQWIEAIRQVIRDCV